MRLALLARCFQVIPYGQRVPCPGKKAFASPKKAVVSLFPMGL
jgi:hypothetical protein